jgi:hypothetical protein
MGVDNFHIGPFTVKAQSFGLIKEERGSTFTELPLEGIVGLAFPSMSAGGVRAFFDTVIDQKLLKKNMFAFYFSPSGTGQQKFASILEGGGGGRTDAYKPGMDAVLWGGVDKQLYEGEISWFPVTQAHYWAMDLHAFYVGEEKMEFGGGGDSLLGVGENRDAAPAKLIVDSGTAYYTAEDALYHKIMDKVSCGPNGVVEDSHGVETAPKLTYKLKDVDGNVRSLVILPEEYIVSACQPGIVRIPVPPKYGPAMILGELFMRKYFTVFDRGDGSDGDARIGFARSRPGADMSGSLTTGI